MRRRASRSVEPRTGAKRVVTTKAMIFSCPDTRPERAGRTRGSGRGGDAGAGNGRTDHRIPMRTITGTHFALTSFRPRHTGMSLRSMVASKSGTVKRNPDTLTLRPPGSALELSRGAHRVNAGITAVRATPDR